METAKSATLDAIQTMRAGHCQICKQVRVEKPVEFSAGFGQGMKTEMIFVCGNPQCTNCGKS